jgi:hypothetical protein
MKIAIIIPVSNAKGAGKLNNKNANKQIINTTCLAVLGKFSNVAFI